MKKHSYIISEHCPDSSIPPIPIAIFHGDSKEEVVKNVIRIIAKWLSHGDISLIMNRETLVEKDKESIEKIIREDLDGGIFFGDDLIYIEPFYERPDSIDDDGKGFGPNVRTVILDEKTLLYHDGYEEAVTQHPNCVYYAPILTEESYDSPFFHPTPFILKESGTYAVDAETGMATGPYDKVRNDFDLYIVYRYGKAGIVSESGKQLLDCVYDTIDSNLGYAILWKDHKVGLFDQQRNLLIPCEYDDIDFEFSDAAPHYVYLWKRGEKGLIATDESFHPLTDKVSDENYEYL